MHLANQKRRRNSKKEELPNIEPVRLTDTNLYSVAEGQTVLITRGSHSFINRQTFANLFLASLE